MRTPKLDARPGKLIAELEEACGGAGQRDRIARWVTRVEQTDVSTRTMGCPI